MMMLIRYVKKLESSCVFISFTKPCSCASKQQPFQRGLGVTIQYLGIVTMQIVQLHAYKCSYLINAL